MASQEETSAISVEAWVRALQSRRVRLPHEIAVFVALSCCEQCLDAPRSLSTREVSVTSEGAIVVDSRSFPAEEVISARSIVQLLATLLLASGPSIPAPLLALIERGSSEAWSLSHLRDALEVLLVPLNRGASTRVLARSLREIRRTSVLPPADIAALPDLAALDAEMDALLASELLKESDAPLGDPTPIDLEAAHGFTEDDS